jgi:hypothetical protein
MRVSDYRADIDGLRAIAVLLVVLAHLGLGQAGGFVGVDVFFVISGYLITGIVRGDLRDGTFSFRRFYARRARRILPALVAVSFVCLAAGWFLLLPSDFEALGTQAVAALLGLSNFYFALKTGYFDQSAGLLPLLHTWSLGVEEQFYLVWPLGLLLLHRRLKLSPKVLAWLGGCALLLFLAVAQLIVENYPDVSFYVPFTRVWELALGAALTYLPRVTGRVLTEGAPIAGLTMIAAAALLYSDETSFPGVAALLPCLGAALILLPSPKETVAKNSADAGQQDYRCGRCDVPPLGLVCAKRLLDELPAEGRSGHGGQQYEERQLLGNSASMKVVACEDNDWPMPEVERVGDTPDPNQRRYSCARSWMYSRPRISTWRRTAAADRSLLLSATRPA